MSNPPRPLPQEGMRELDIIYYDGAHPGGQQRREAVILERPLSVEVDGSVYTLLRTPGEDRELVAGFLFTEGLIAKPDDIMLLRECPESPDVITVRTRNPEDKPRRTLVITSSCGLCGRADVNAMVEALGRVESDFRVPLAVVLGLSELVRAKQPLFELTGGAHASALFDAGGHVLGVKEDVGRHNALDKLIGHAFLRGISLGGLGVFLSGRISLELIAKAARARIPVVAAVGAPTAVAIEAADRLGIALCGFVRDKRLSVYANGWRIES